MRFAWSIDDGCMASVPVGGQNVDSDGVRHVLIDMDIPNVAGNAPALLTLPADTGNGAITEQCRAVGVVLAHGEDAASWREDLMNSIANVLARSGHVVMRNFCALKELRRLRLYEKALDAAARSPYARAVTSWVVIGLGNGARIAASIAGRTKQSVCGAVLLSYPLWDPTPPAGKGAGAPDSTGPISRLQCPLLLVHAQHDFKCTLGSLVEFCPCLVSSIGPPYLVQVPGASADFKAVASGTYTALICSKVTGAIQEFVESLDQNRIKEARLPLYDSAQAMLVPLPSSFGLSSQSEAHVKATVETLETSAKGIGSALSGSARLESDVAAQPRYAPKLPQATAHDLHHARGFNIPTVQPDQHLA